ncbi:MAG: glycoside hydrolase family 3 C-terminal domain-containing protein, partial [Bifidobacteriaceae bacterium]|nr:glycoside hydrolase family 3 C-terminal domain-containing protein [Bifidobacteriaceae bacterium]
MWHRAVSAAAAVALAATGLVAVAGAPAQAAPPTPPYLDDSGAYTFEERAADLVSRMTRAEKLTQFTASTSRTSASPIPRLGVEGYGYWSEALHGIARAGEATAFPTGLGIGSTWNRDLVYQMTDAASDEARAKWYSNQVPGLTFWSPTINMDRDPRWGRAEETYGEDPYLTGQLAAGFVDGLQSDDGTYLKAVATAKHLAANNHENSRHADSSDMPEHTLREYYLPAFQVLAEDHDLGSLMTSYNRVNGVPAPASRHLVEELLRRTWGFHGFITSDCGAIYDVGGAGHHWTPEGADHQVTRIEATAYSLKAGTDVDCTGEQYTANLGPAIDQGLLAEADLDVSLVRVFTERMRLGEFDRTNPWPSSLYTVAREVSAPDHLQIAEDMSEEALVLLKNEPAAGETSPVLPLSSGQDQIDDIVVVGQRAGQWELGDYSPHSVDPADNGINTPLYGVRQAVTALGGDGAADVTFVGNNNSGTLSGAEVSEIAAADAVIVVIGTIGSDSAEERDRDTLNFPRGQVSFVTQAIAANPRTVVYVTSVAQMNIEPFRADVPAILWSTYNGQRQGTALGRVLWGIDGTNPSGHLPFTWYTDESQIPNIKDYQLAPHDGGSGRTYQFFSGDVSYPFGSGLSYAQFSYSPLTLSRSTVSPDGAVTASVKVTNTSGLAGHAVVQLYAKSPGADGQTRPVSRLIEFEKVRLGSWQSRVVTFPVEIADLWFWDDDAARAVIDTGTWTLTVGGNASDDAASAPLTVAGSWTKAVKTVRAIPSGHVIDMSVPGSTLDAGASAVANDQTFYNLDDIDVTYSSSNASVAAVNWRGTVSGVGDGVATITVTATAGGVTESDTFPVVVKHAPPALDAIALDAVALPGFDPAVESYTVPAAGPVFPTVTASGEAGLSVEIDQATSTTRIATVTVTDTAGGYRVYTIRFTYPFQTYSFASSPPLSEAELASQGWTMVRSNDSAWRTTTTGLEIDTGFGDFHQASSNPPRNVLTHDSPGDWIATVKITPRGQINQNYQQGFIGVYQDDDNYVKVGLQNGGLVFVTESGASTTQVGPNRGVGSGNPTPPVWLRIQKTGDQYSGYYSLNGSVFYRMGEPGTLYL